MATRGVANRYYPAGVGQIELPEVFQIGGGKSRAVVLGEAFQQIGDKACTHVNA